MLIVVRLRLILVINITVYILFYKIILEYRLLFYKIILEYRLAKGNQVRGEYLLPSNPSVHTTEHLILCKRNKGLFIGLWGWEGSSDPSSPSPLTSFPPSEAELAYFQSSSAGQRKLTTTRMLVIPLGSPVPSVVVLDVLTGACSREGHRAHWVSAFA